MSFSSFTRTEIQSLFKRSTMRVRSSGLKIMTAACTSDSSRLLLIASAKTGNSPVRNLFKRRLRSIFREDRFVFRGVDFIVIADKTGVGLSFENLKDLFYKAFDRHNSATQ